MTSRFRFAVVAALVVAAAAAGAAIRVAAAQAQAAAAVPIWIDTDPAVGVADRDVDDGFALLQAFHSPELALRGVSVVFGNAPLVQAWPIGLRIVGGFGPRGVRAYRGAAKAADLGTENPATRALAAALKREPLVILVLGPATNVATVIRNQPALRARIVRIVAVAGRRPGQRFTTGTTNPRGHRDFNFEEDPEAFRVLLASGVPLTLAPFEISSKVWLKTPELDAVARGDAKSAWIVAPARRWLALWTRTFGVDGFNPFDTLAVARITSPSQLTCERLPARIDVLADDATEAQVQGTTVARKPYLLLSREFGGSVPSVEYCYDVAEGFKADLLRRITARR
jgi:inosine-uridine nucleoside N-ribohydrolase